MSIKITATSTCDLPPELLERYQITIVPLYVSFGGNTCRDGVEAGPEDIFRHVVEGRLPPPSTWRKMSSGPASTPSRQVFPPKETYRGTMVIW